MKKNYKTTIRKFEKNYENKGTRKLEDLKNRFVDKEEIKEILEEEGNLEIYETFTKTFSPIKLTLTVVNPGTVDREFYLTKGHVHKNRSPEFYILLEGKGSLVLQKAGKPKEIKLKKGNIALIPGGYAHRLANTGNKKLKVLTIYHEDSKPDYHLKFKKRVYKKNKSK